jgi:hypothetical protein
MYFKRAKIFLHQDSNGGELRYLAPVGGPVSVPNWVCKTLGYKLGIQDKSIVDVTAPKVIAPIEPDEEPVPVPQDGPPTEPVEDIPDEEEAEEPEDTAVEEDAPANPPAKPAKTPAKPSRAGKGTVR